MATTTQTQAEQELGLLKRCQPFLEWYAYEVNGEWFFVNSWRKLRGALTKHYGAGMATFLSAQPGLKRTGVKTA